MVFLYFRSVITDCTGSNILCNYIKDTNGTLLHSGIENLVWPYDKVETTLYKRIKTMNKNMIIVIMKFKTSQIDYTVLDARTTLSDKIANLGGTFGIWAEVTGLSTLGIINLVLLLVKLLFRLCRNGN